MLDDSKLHVFIDLRAYIDDKRAGQGEMPREPINTCQVRSQ